MISDILEDSVMVRFLDWLLEMPNTEFSKSDVSKQINSTFPSVKPLFDKLEKLEIIKKIRVVGKSQLYKINEDSKILMALSRFDLLLSSKLMEVKSPLKKVEKMQVVARQTPLPLGI